MDVSVLMHCLGPWCLKPPRSWGNFSGLPSLKLTPTAPENRPSLKERIVFQPSSFTCYCWWKKSCTSWYVVIPSFTRFMYSRWCRISESSTVRYYVSFREDMCPPFISLYPSQIYHIEAWHGVAWPVMVFAYYEKLWLFFGGEGKTSKLDVGFVHILSVHVFLIGRCMNFAFAK